MSVNALLHRLVTIYQGAEIQYPRLRGVTLAQWMLESGRATSKLAKQHYNFAGLKWRREMAPYAKRVRYEAHDGVDFYCKFSTIGSFIKGYWAFLNRAPYSGWEEHVGTPEEFIRFIGPIYTPSKTYSAKVLALLPEAEKLLSQSSLTTAVTAMPVSSDAWMTDLGAIVIDPGHGGVTDEPGSSANNAISVSGVKEKHLTLDYCVILRDELVQQARKAKENITVVLTRSTDVNLSGKKRAGMAFDNKAKIFLSLHFNGNKNPAIRGSETFYRAKENGNLNLKDDVAFAKEVHDAMFGSILALDPRAKDRGLKPDTETQPKALGVLNDKNLGNDKVENMCRAGYLEVEFISNPAVENLLVSGPDAIANRTKVMAAVAKAIRAHMKQMPSATSLTS
jgi:N-acetylmuramoyl-L-alanine amidase